MSGLGYLEALILGGLVGEAVAIPTGGYVYSNYISKQKTWRAWTIGAVGTGILFPIIAFYTTVGLADYQTKQRMRKTDEEIGQRAETQSG